MQSSTQLTRSTCDNVGGLFIRAVDVSDSTTEATPADLLPGVNSSVDQCYYYTFDCPGYTYGGQCYSNKSSEMSCPTCNNIGGMFVANSGCYYESSDCTDFSVDEQCHANRCDEQLFVQFFFLNNFLKLFSIVFTVYTNKKISLVRTCRVLWRFKVQHTMSPLR